MSVSLPDLALSVRQPWAWAIIHAGKDVENRSWQAVNHGLKARGRIAIHAAKGMSREEYFVAKDFMDGIGLHTCPEPALLERGGIIGSVEVIDVVSEYDSPWFFGPRGLILRNPTPCAFIAIPGSLGYFRWRDGVGYAKPAPIARWMIDRPQKQEALELPGKPEDVLL